MVGIIEDSIEIRNSRDAYTLDEAVNEASKKSLIICEFINQMWLFSKNFFSEIGKYQVFLIFMTFISVFGSGIENANVSYILPFAKCDLNLTTEDQGLISASSFLGVVFFSHFWGFLSDTWGRQKVLRFAATGSFIFSFSSAFAVNKITMFICRFFAGAL